MDIINNKNIIINNSDNYNSDNYNSDNYNSDNYNASKMNLSFKVNNINNIVGGKYICNPNTNKSEQICSTQTKDQLSKSNKNIFKTKTECENECEKKFINVQLKKSNLFNESVQFYLFIKDLINKEHMKIYIKGGNVIGLAVLKLIYDEYKSDNAKFSYAFKNFLSMELIKDWDFTAYTNGKDTDEKYRAKLDKLAAKYKLVPRAKTFILYQTKVPILVYEKALFEIAIIPEDTPYSKMEIPLTTMKVEVNEHNLKYIFIMAKNFYSYKTKSIPIDLNIVKKVISRTNIIIHPHKNGLYDPGYKIDTGDLNLNLISFIKNLTSGDKYWTQFLITQLEDPYRLIYRMPEKNLKKTKQISEFIKTNLPKTSKPNWLLDTKKTYNVLENFIDKLGFKLKKIYLETLLLESVLDFLKDANFGKPQIQIEWNELGLDAKNRIKRIFEPMVIQIGKKDFKKMIISLIEKYNLKNAKPAEISNSERIIIFFNFLNEKNFF
jgi:hypothetical protein